MILFLSSVHVASQALLVAATTTTKATAKSSGSSGFLIVVILLGLGGYFFIRPQRKKQRLAQQNLREISVGEEVITTSGIYGNVVRLYDDRAVLEIAKDTRIEIARQAIARAVPPPATPDNTVGGTVPEDWDAPTGFEPPSDAPHDSTTDTPDSGSWGTPPEGSS